MAKDSFDGLMEQTDDARVQAWGEWGEVSPDVLTHLINPSLAGGPRWPAMRQSFRTARKDHMVLVASNGLSDPWDDGRKANGFGLEFFAITGDPLDATSASWLWDLVWQMSQFAAKHGGIADLLDEMGLISTELYDVRIPEEHRDRFVNDAGRVGVLLGMVDEPMPDAIEGPLSSIRLANVKLLTLPELEHVAENGEEARQELDARFCAMPGALVSSLTRPSLV